MQTVAINKEIFEFTCAQEKMAKSVQEEFVHYVATQLNNLILKIVSEQLNNSDSIRIDKIEIDLGDVLWPEFGESAMLEKFEHDFTQQISKLKNNLVYRLPDAGRNLAANLPTSLLDYTAADSSYTKTYASSSAKQTLADNPERIDLTHGKALAAANEEWELVQAFLLRGDLPWWADKSKPANLDAMVRRLITGQPQILQNFLQEQRENSVIWLRLAGQLKPATQILINQLLDGPAPVATVKGYWQKAGFTIPVFSFTKEQLTKLKAFFQRMKSVSADSRKAQLLQKLMELNSLGWMQQAALFDWLPEPEFKIVQAFFSRQNKAIAGSEKKKVLAALQLLTPFQIEFLLYPTSLPDRPVTYQLAEGKSQPVSNNPEPETPESKDSLKLSFSPGEPGILPKKDGASSRDIPPSFPGNSNLEPDPQGNQETSFLTENIINWSVLSGQEKVADPTRLAAELAARRLPNQPALIRYSNPEFSERNAAKEAGLQQPYYPGVNNEPVAARKISKKQEAENRSKSDNRFLNPFLPKTTKPVNAEVSKTGNLELLNAVTSEQIESKPVRPEIKLAGAEGKRAVADTIKTEANPMKVEEEAIMAKVETMTFETEKVAAATEKVITLTETWTTAAETKSDEADKKTVDAIDSFDQQGIYYKQSITSEPIADYHSPAAPGKQLAFILKKLARTNPVVTQELQQLSKPELRRLREIFTRHLRHEQERRQLVGYLLQHPFLLQYNLLSILVGLPDFIKPAAGPVTPAPLDTTAATETAAGRTRRYQGIKLESQLKNLQTQVLAVLNNLTVKETAVIQDIFLKAAFHTQNEKGMLRRVLTKLPTESLFFLQFLTELPAAEIQKMQGIAPDLASATSENSRPPTYRTDLFKEAPTKVYVENAGLCLLAPYLPGLFTELNYRENKQLKNKYVATRALQVTQYLVTGKRQSPEYLLLLNKVLCGVKIEEGLPGTVRLTKKEISEADSLLEAVIQHWKALKNTSPPGFRESFLQRKGILTESESRWTLQVERKGHDLLLNTIPWGFTIIKLPWMEKMLQVEW